MMQEETRNRIYVQFELVFIPATNVSQLIAKIKKNTVAFGIFP